MGEEQKEKLLLQQNNIEGSNVKEEESLRKKAWEESKKMWMVAGPAIFTRLSTFGILVVSQSFIGHIGSTELAAYALVQTVLVRFANGVLVSIPPLFMLSLLHLNSIKKILRLNSMFGSTTVSAESIMK